MQKRVLPDSSKLCEQKNKKSHKYTRPFPGPPLEIAPTLNIAGPNAGFLLRLTNGGWRTYFKITYRHQLDWKSN